MNFKDFNLHPDLQKGIDEAEYITCMPVQEQVLSHAFGGQSAQPAQDLYVQSQTGTGKTAAFLIVIFQRMLTEEALFKKKALIMAPTRELAVQIEEEAKMLSRYLPFKTGSFYGGVGYAQQEKLLKDNAQILVGTPGRVLDLNKSGRMNLMEIAFLVLDEADRMFDMGFYPDLRKLIKVVPSADRRQTMLFSATLNAWVKNLAWEYTKKPFEIEIEPETVTVEEITQVLYHVPSEDKMTLLLGIIKREQPESMIIFCNTKKSTEIVAKRLKLNGMNCEFIIGDLPQSKRLKIIDDVKAGKIKTLVATDVAARGLDIEALSMVINYDLPVEAENYVHRIGRTARAGKTGKAVTLASEQDVYELPAIERYIGKKIPSEIAGQELYAQDNSAGQRIHTDFYEERHHSGAKPFGGKRRDEKRKPEPRKAREDGGKRRHENAPRRDGVTRKSVPKPAEQDLSRLSMEERMALYKKKYTPGEAKHGGNREHGRQNTAKRRHEPANVTRTNRPKVEQREKQKPQEQAAPAKKGILSKLKGLFKKK
ncbi:MAG: DEAD/DEAH box helicase [Treponema sp.]|jgi:ATP-dependent RNA helicase RhlB|nr:DEAD/DEAH box helicase [Treponema sp.]